MIPHRYSDLAGQIVRFGLTGGLLTVLVAAGYWLVATPLHVEPMLSLTLNYLWATGLGYVLHSRFSFRGHGSRDRAAVRTARFFMVNAFGFVLNQAFVWLLVRHLDGPTWWAIPPMLFVTPALTFALNRQWVFA
ncbi:MAG TPA: GtrA family protein [Allosphingosinicella sp.]